MWGFWDQNKELVCENNILNKEVWTSIGATKTLIQMPLSIGATKTLTQMPLSRDVT